MMAVVRRLRDGGDRNLLLLLLLGMGLLQEIPEGI